jgi:hypothetical protein
MSKHHLSSIWTKPIDQKQLPTLRNQEQKDQHLGKFGQATSLTLDAPPHLTCQAGGWYAPVYAEYFQAQLKLTSGRRDLVMDSIGITNGCIDVLQQAPFFPQFAINNTYDLQAIPTSVAEEAAANFTKPAGCRDLLIRCRTLADQGDSGFRGDNLTINQACVEATSFCLPYVLRAYDDFSNVLYSILAPPSPR